MKLPQTITFTGADDRNDVAALMTFARKYPEVEFGILVSANQQGRPRYPSNTWLNGLAFTSIDYPDVKLSIHLQGRLLRWLLLGLNENEVVRDNRPWFVSASRFQLNFHTDPIEAKLPAFLDRLTLPPFEGKQVIFQCDGAQGEEFFIECWGESQHLNLAPFFDASGGGGVLPREWPRADYVASPGGDGLRETLALHGYAGGLGPHNIGEQLPLIAAAAGDAPYWIDMETHVCDPERGLLLDRCADVVEAVRAMGSAS